MEVTVSNTSNIDARCIEYERFLKLLVYQIQTTSGGDVGGRRNSARKSKNMKWYK